MMKLLSGAIMACALVAPPGFASAEPTSTSSRVNEPAKVVDIILGIGRSEVTRECCKICRKSKACGDSCISREKACWKGPGCACDG